MYNTQGHNQGCPYPPNAPYPNTDHTNQSYQPKPPYPPNPPYPSSDYPNHPQPLYPPQGYPNQGYPTQGYPNQGYPTQGYPNQGYPTQGYPNQGYINQGYLPQGYQNQSSLSTSVSSEGVQAMSQPAYNSPGEDPTAAFDFSDKTIRRGFIRKVYSILTSQLLITIAFVALFIYDKRINKYVASHYGFLIAAIVLVFVLSIVLACCGNVRRSSPMNYICLFLFTIAMGFLTGVAAAQYSTQEVMIALGMTAAITLGLTLFAFQTKIDFTGCGGALFALILVLIVGGIFCMFFPSRVLQTAIAGFGAFLMSLYIIYDTQLMLGGSHKYSISPEEYVFASLNLYLDIVNLFLYILQLIGGKNS